jgi:hypothetical protein
MTRQTPEERGRGYARREFCPRPDQKKRPRLRAPFISPTWAAPVNGFAVLRCAPALRVTGPRLACCAGPDRDEERSAPPAGSNKEQGESTLYEGMTLDGRARYKACRQTGIEPRFVTYDGNDPLAYVISMNVTRASYSEDQIAFFIAELTRAKPTGGEAK